MAHLLVTQEHLETAPYVGWLFVVFELACAALAVALLRGDSDVVWRLTGLAGAAAIAAYAVARSFAMPQISNDVGNWDEPLGVVCLVVETFMVVLAVAVLLGRVRARRAGVRTRVTWGTGRSVLAGASVLFVGLAATATAEAGTAAAHHGAKHTASSTSGYWAAVGGSGVPPGGKVRTYYIGADEVLWNYAPHGRNDITGKPFDEVADVFVKRGPNRIGSTYRKCLYRSYTNASFAALRPRPASEAYLGLLGPVIRAEVGDTVKVVFRNACRFPTSVHPHGVFYAKNSEGAAYDDGTAKKRDDAVPQGGRHTYTWKVPLRAGPGPGDGSSVMWMYHSHTDEVTDTNAGLVGPMVVTARGQARRDGSPRDVDREVFTLFTVMNENVSPYLDDNRSLAEQSSENGEDEEAFEESNLMHSINGYVYGNMPMINLHQGSHVRWYVMSMGTEVDLHTPHWHGNNVVAMGMRTDVVSLLPASMVVADMAPDNVGIWLLHCHVNDHILAGMQARFRVTN